MTRSVFRDGDEGLGAEVFRVDESGNVFASGSFRPNAMDLAEYFPVSVPVGPGDVLAVDRDNSGSYRLASDAADPAVVGIVSAQPGVLLGSGIAQVMAADSELARQLDEARQLGDAKEEARLWSELEQQFQQTHAAVALSGTVLCKVDAGYGAIRPGDLLTTSPRWTQATARSDPATC